MKTFISNLLVLLPATVLVAGLTLIVSFPKAVVLDRIMMDRNIHLVPARVDEELSRISFEDLNVFFKNEPVAKFAKAELYLGMGSVKFEGRCRTGKVEAELYLGGMDLKFSSADCFEGAGSISGRLELKGDRIKGDLKVKDLLARDVKIDRLRLLFKGNKFDGEIEYMGTKLVGGGTIKLNPKDPMKSEVRGEFKGSAGKVAVWGKLDGIRIGFR